MDTIFFWTWAIGLVCFIIGFGAILNHKSRIALFLCGLGIGSWISPCYALFKRFNEIKSGLVEVNEFDFQTACSLLLGQFGFGLLAVFFVIVMTILHITKTKGG